jgi:cholesterol transport system auxiliary component
MTPRRRTVLIATLPLAACTSWPTSPAPAPHIYRFEAPALAAPAPARTDLVLTVATPLARPGFETAAMVYVERPYELNYFVTSRWAAAPARMLQPLLVQALEQRGAFRAVLPAAGATAGDLRLETELVRLEQDFTVRPSRIRLTLGVQLIDARRERVLATTRIDETETATSDDAYGGVGAANRALQRALDALTRFCIAAIATP